MKPIILNNITAMTSADVEKSLPVAISLVEYSSNLGNEKSTLECLRNDDDHNGDGHNKGTLGNMFLSYSIDCKHGIINRKEGTDELLKFKYIEDKITSMKCPTFSRRFLADNFFIYAIPDYSRQAMTPGFSDMVVVIYTTEGRKVPQRYIGMIKSYTQEMCYVLVDKSIQKLDSFKTFEESDHKAKTFEIRIKQNAETDPEVDPQTLTIINDHQDYAMLYSYTDESYVYDENDVFLDGEAFCEEDSSALLNAQALYPDNRIKDYFKQILLIDYDKESHNNTLMRANEISYNYITDSTINPGYDINLMKVYSAQRIPEFLDTDEVDSSTGKIFKITASVQNEYEENFEVFDSMTGRLLIPHVDFEYEYTANESDKPLLISGIKVNLGPTTPKAIEILPYYDTHRRIRLYGHFRNNNVPTTKAGIREALINFLNNSAIDANIDEDTLRMYNSNGMLVDTLITEDNDDNNTYFVLSDFEHTAAFPTTSTSNLGNNVEFVLGYGNLNDSDIKPERRGTIKTYNCFSLYPGKVNDKKLCDNMEIYSDDVRNNLHIKHDEVTDTSKTTELTVYNLESNKQGVKYSASNYANDVVELKANIAKAREELNDKISYICDELCKRLSLLASKDKAFASEGSTLAPNSNNSFSRSEIVLDDVNCAFICVKLTDGGSTQESNAVCWEKIDDSFSDTDFIPITSHNGWYILPFLEGYHKIIFKYNISATYYFYDGGFENE